MPITRGKSDVDFGAYIDKVVAGVEAKIIRVFCKIGAYGYDLAYSHGSYQDRSGNLRSSIGWGVAKDGKLVKTGGFKQVLNGGAGASLGKQTLREIASEQRSGVSLIIAIGEKYAIYVEALGDDVLTFSELQCEKVAENLINSILK